MALTEKLTAIADAIRQRIRETLGMTISVGVCRYPPSPCSSVTPRSTWCMMASLI